MKEMPRLVIVLTVIAILSGLVLTFTFNVTNEKIIRNAEIKRKAAIRDVLPGLASYEVKQKGSLSYYQGYDTNGNPIGIAIEAYGGGFQGEIKLMIGLIPDEKKISAIKVLSHLETPGLGARITEESFKSNFKDKPFGDYTVVKRPARNKYEVEAISGATISSEAVTSIVENTLEAVKEAFGGEW
ncbi:hypothetical protein BBF96_07815 [Anoxybacter fermentans]|uniref:Ion-translocating oxidoreductase complex subunit G n=1 Tax=Anoxybacter fermentans TaxID=1323375 RepID=A0A3S9SYG5_9FIRM|nr:RnfABCDGE type electron transport complex subunit G [Anoxybacter fermentans]AZR73298.1 hypothetical protein BBF96_07815 [Anoxybacter fermentans]